MSSIISYDDGQQTVQLYIYPAFSFMACTGTSLTTSLGYRNLKCRRVPKYGTYMYIFTLIYVG
jgi:hypothetical protein